MTLQERAAAFVALGKRIAQMSDAAFDELAISVENNNNWFTSDQVRFALQGLSAMLEEEKVNAWLGRYEPKEVGIPKRVGVLMAGNIPAVGFHDLMMVLVSGHIAHVKLSSSDQVLIKWLVNELVDIAPSLGERVVFEEMLKAKDAYIATGSDNSARYFDYYFGKYPSIIRKNRTSVAVLDGRETEKDFQELAKDIFQYFGLGCRNVSKVFLPNKELLQAFLKAIEGYSFTCSHHKYLNNYEYNKSIYLVNCDRHLDNGFLLCKESEELVSPIAVLYFEEYANTKELEQKLVGQQEKIQCIVSKEAWYPSSVAFGQAQRPEIDDFADHVDTFSFLQGL
ncbi:acyl-CoA reductase [Echinicola strongylocentroti]|uniref:Acyl-CoA reductase n=1 Tax=Echinicola strongylocentroti TaxID=1795355 RepID=A0A2Z4IM18_9BACT|nr:acyl-CoA reductase [Echinicola strongylocentroti]AWW31995.1 acyl-CoA reductase [Echinicola strongylocentroti]